jgi:Ca2+/Na+ antiporter
MVQIERVRRPFWTHQLIEYLLGVGLISAAVQMPQPAVPAVLGLVIILNAAITKGAAGAFRWSSKRVHRQLDVVVMVLLVAAAAQPWVSMDNVSRLLLVGVAFVLWFVWFHTDFTEKVPRAERKATKATEAAKPSSEAIGRGAGRVVGGGVNSFKRWKDSFGAGADDDA